MQNAPPLEGAAVAQASVASTTAPVPPGSGRRLVNSHPAAVATRRQDPSDWDWQHAVMPNGWTVVAPSRSLPARPSPS